MEKVILYRIVTTLANIFLEVFSRTMRTDALGQSFDLHQRNGFSQKFACVLTKDDRAPYGGGCAG